MLAESLAIADTLDIKKLIMRYRRLKAECRSRDSMFVDRILLNYFTQVKKTGILEKYSNSMLGGW